MKSLSTVFGLAFILACYSPATLSQSFIVAISPFQQEGQAKPFVKQLLKRLSSFKAGSNIAVIDGYHLQRITSFIIPEGNLKAKAIIKRNRTAVATLMRFASKNAGATAETINTVRLPQLLHYVAENYHPDPSGELDVIVLASPFYADPQEPNVSMASAYIPSDGHIHSSRASSPYGTAETGELLKAVRVHLGFEENADIISDQHGFFLRRFWTLYIENQGGKLVSFMSDIDMLFERVSHHALPLQHNFRLESSTKLEMIRLRREKPSNPIYERELSSQPLSSRTIQSSENVEIGIQWDCAACDLDLYARGSASADILYFGRNVTQMGNHWKDFTSSPSLSNAYETISFKVPVDLRQLRLAINFYNGAAPNGIKGSIRLSVSGQTYEKPFTIPATSGNKSKGMEASFQTGIAASKHIVMFEALNIIQPQKNNY